MMVKIVVVVVTTETLSFGPSSKIFHHVVPVVFGFCSDSGPLAALPKR